MGIDLLIVGILILLVASGFAFYTVCPSTGPCHTEVDWLTLLPAISLLTAGSFLTAMARIHRSKAG